MLEYRIIHDFGNIDLAARPSPGSVVLGKFIPVWV
jgi:hypothetical protein